MALVHVIYEQLDLGYGVFGRFYGDGEYCMATEEQPGRVFRYSLSSGIPIKLDVQQLGVEQCEVDSELSTGHSKGKRDKIWAMINVERGWYECWYMDGEKKKLVEHGKQYAMLHTSPTALDMACTLSWTGLRLYSGTRCVYNGTCGLEEIGRMILVNQKYCLAHAAEEEDGVDGWLINFATNSRAEVTLQNFVNLMPASRNSETLFIWFNEDGAHIKDAEDIFRYIEPIPDNALTLANVDKIASCEFLKYDEPSGNTIFLVNKSEFFIFDGTNAVPLINRLGGRYVPQFPYLESQSFSNISRIYSYIVKDSNEIVINQVAETYHGYFNGPLRHEVSLLGNNYHFPSAPGFATVSKNMFFKPVKTVLNTEAGSVEDIFRINDRLVLAVGRNFARVCDITKGVVNREYWYKPGETIFANATYQVQPETVHTENGQLFNPLNTEVLFANVHGDSLIIGSKTQVALVNNKLEVIETFDEQEIVNVFPGGYATSCKIKQFGKADIELLNIKTAWSDGNMLIVENSGTSPLYSVDDSKLIECKLGAGFLNKAYDCGTGVIVEAEKSSILFRNNEFVRLKNIGSKCVLSKDLETCFVLDEGSLYIKANTGVHPFIKIESNCSNAINLSSPVSQTQICESKVVRYHEGPTKKYNVVHIQSFDGRIKETRHLPRSADSSYMYFLLRDKHLMEIAYFYGSDKEEPIKVTICKLTDMSTTCTIDISLAFKKLTSIKYSYYENEKPHLDDFVHVDYEKCDIFFVAECLKKERIPGNASIICHLDEGGIMLRKAPSENQEIANEEEKADLENNVFQNSLNWRGTRRLDYPYRGDHMLTRLWRKFLVQKREEAPFKVVYQQSSARLLIYTQSKCDPNIYYAICEGNGSCEYSLLKVDASSGAETPIGRFKYDGNRPDNPLSVVSKGTCSTEYDPELLLSGRRFILGIVPMPEPHNYDGIVRIFSKAESAKFWLPTYELINGGNILKALEDESNYQKFLDIGEDPVEWHKKLSLMLR